MHPGLCSGDLSGLFLEHTVFICSVAVAMVASSHLTSCWRSTCSKLYWRTARLRNVFRLRLTSNMHRPPGLFSQRRMRLCILLYPTVQEHIQHIFPYGLNLLPGEGLWIECPQIISVLDPPADSHHKCTALHYRQKLNVFWETLCRRSAQPVSIKHSDVVCVVVVMPLPITKAPNHKHLCPCDVGSDPMKLEGRGLSPTPFVPGGDLYPE